MTPYVPKPLTSGAKAEGRFGKQDFVYVAEDNTYRCPAGESLTWRFSSVEARNGSAQLLDDTVRKLHAQNAMHDRSAAPHQALGA